MIMITTPMTVMTMMTMTVKIIVMNDLDIPPHAKTDESEYDDDSCSHRGPHSHR